MKNALTQDEVCKEYCLSLATIYRLRKKGILKAHKFLPEKNSTAYFFRSEIEAALREVDEESHFLPDDKAGKL